MISKTWKFPLREDFTFTFIVAEHEESKKIADRYKLDHEWVESHSGMSLQTNTMDFVIVLFDQSFVTLVHECSHIGFYVCQTFGIDNEEYHCNVVEWCYKKCCEFIEYRTKLLNKLEKQP